MPIIRLLVAVDVRSGTPITRCITGTFTMPPPTPRSAEFSPATTEPAIPAGRRRTTYPGPEMAAANVGASTVGGGTTTGLGSRAGTGSGAASAPGSGSVAGTPLAAAGTASLRRAIDTATHTSSAAN